MNPIPVPTLVQFKRYVSKLSIHYFIGGNGSVVGNVAGTRSEGDSARITSWVKSHFTYDTLDGVRVYDLARRPRL